ncbi:hypothetical protein VitviT2T_025699 [Vitis vinifera]|uniref:Protein ROOT initiation defective 3 n=1 Tax=Vitis vinifera TaxID=29760 RepID=A0ABY9DLJ3_VITVI|nr:protein ROOT INITIATION DEFECTIVE 3 isoform X1 [Vitis vinifera]WKA07929.1 hypothetical protein VitviT2T_025699 [Vitis vinifera]|eukprot:XP_002279752.3 PREDICTED: protein ROOT INITIATION DEFECTIVE 3 isoform X1 [Vitis vinifera]
MREKKMDWSGGREALVVCSDRSMSVGITVWDMVSGDQLLHIPTCAASPHGLLCLREQFLVASQIHRHGSLGGGAIFIWPLNKPQSPLRNYPMEAIGPVSCSKDGVYIVGGAPSGNAYIWEVADGRLLKTWRAHHKSLTSMVFSDDDSLLISGSDDGMIRVWSMISLLDIADCGRFPSLFHSLLEHTSSITGLLSISGSSSPVLVSSSLDGTCKVWDLIRGRLLRTRVFPTAITAIVLDPGEQLLFSGSADGRIFVSMLDTGLVVDPFKVPEDRPIVLNGHNRSITALAFSRLGLVSASRDCAAHLWDVASGVIIRRFNHPKGAITNMVVIPKSSLLSVTNHQRFSNQFRVSLLDKYPQPGNSSMGMITLLPLCCSHRVHLPTIGFQSTVSLNQQILDLEQECTPGAIQMKLETSIENRMWAARMTKHVMEMNKHLQSRLLDLMQNRLLLSADSTAARKRKRAMLESSRIQEEEQSQLPSYQ